MSFDPEDPRLTAYALGELDDDETRAFEAELAGSEDAAHALDEIRETARLLSQSLGDEPRLSLFPAQIKAIEGEIAAPSEIVLKPKRSWQTWAGYGLAASALVGFGLSAAWVASGGLLQTTSVMDVAMNRPESKIQGRNLESKHEESVTSAPGRAGGIEMFDAAPPASSSPVVDHRFGMQPPAEADSGVMGVSPEQQRDQLIAGSELASVITSNLRSQPDEMRSRRSAANPVAGGMPGGVAGDVPALVTNEKALGLGEGEIARQARGLSVAADAQAAPKSAAKTGLPAPPPSSIGVPPNVTSFNGSRAKLDSNFAMKHKAPAKPSARNSMGRDVSVEPGAKFSASENRVLAENLALIQGQADGFLSEKKMLSDRMPGEVQDGKPGVPADAPVALAAPVVENPRQEAFAKVEDNAFDLVGLKPLSTFSIDVDTASYALVRRFLKSDGILPPPDAVRIEEMVNYFPYSYAAPNLSDPQSPPFSVDVEIARAPWSDNRLARIALKGKVETRARVSNLVFLVDVSGSMDQPNKLPLVQASLRMLTEQLGENDRVSIVVYAGAAGLVLDSVGGYDKPKIAQAIDNLKAGGSTAGGEGINLAYKIAQKNFIHGGINRVILATDGDFNVGVSDVEGLKRLAEEKRATNVFLSVLGYGTGNIKDDTMEGIANKGNGNYYYIDSLLEARKVLIEEMGGTLVTIAKDVKIQVDFNPAKVAAYRLIGYENRVMAAEDFANDKKDAGEIGAGHTVTALYELVLAGKEIVAAKDAGSKYVKVIPADPANAEMFTVKLRYKAPAGDKSDLIERPVTDEGKDFAAASEDFKFASSVAGFGMFLRQSPHMGTVTLDGLLETASSNRGKDPGGYREEFCGLIRKAKELMGHSPAVGR